MNIDFIYPEYLYHGTVLEALESFKQQLINPEYWGPRRKRARVNLDFGKGFYTTIDLKQALKWGVKRAKKEFDNPCVLQLICMVDQDLSVTSHCVFVGESKKWAEYILDHRTQSVDEPDPCSIHTDIVIGPMADNDTGAVVEEYISQGITDISWFYDKITNKEDDTKLHGMELGNQVAFFNETMAKDFLALHSYWLISETKGEWIQYDLQGKTIHSIRVEDR